MLEVSGVYLWGNVLLPTISGGDSEEKRMMLLNTFGWSESLTNRHPRVFGCRGDYTTYYLFLWLIWSTSRATVPGSHCGPCG